MDSKLQTLRENIMKLNLEWDKHDKETGMSEAKNAALYKEKERRRAKIQAKVDKALAERHAAELAIEAKLRALTKMLTPEKDNFTLVDYQKAIVDHEKEIANIT